MPGGGITLVGATNVDRVEAPVTVKAYLMCAFAAFGGIFFGYDSGYISGVMGMEYFIHLLTGLDPPPAGATADEKAYFTLPSWKKSLITSILSAGTFFGALIAGDLADFIGRRITIIADVSSSLSASYFKPRRLVWVFLLQAVLLQALVSALCRPSLSCTCQKLHPRRCVERLYPATNFASPLVSCLRRALTMELKIALILVLTESLLPSKCYGL